MLRSLRERLLLAIQENSIKDFQALVKDEEKLKYNEKLVGLIEAIGELNRTQLDVVWGRLCDWTAEQYFNMTNENRGDKDTRPVDCAAFIKMVVQIATLSANKTTSDETPVELIHLVEIFNSLLPEPLASDFGLCSNISRLCEYWWVKKFPGRDKIALQTFFYLLDESLKPNSLRADIKRVWNMRELLVDYTNLDRNHALRPKLLKIAQNKNYLEHEEGQKMIARLFILGPDFIEALHKAIKQRIPYCTIQEAAAYGEIYLRGWRAAINHHDIIAERCLQNLMFHAIHARRQPIPLAPLFPVEKPHSVSSLLFALLHSIHEQKSHSATGEMLYQMYQPLLYRALKVANVHVRANAIRIFLDVFPLLASGEAAEREVSLTNQIAMVQLGLRDEVPLVRVQTIEGLCRVLAVQSHIIPADHLTKFLNVLTTVLLFDASSHEVRTAVVDGLSEMVDNPVTHPYLSLILPKCSVVLHDIHEHVRSSFVELLLKVQRSKTLELLNIVAFKKLCEQLASEKSVMVSRKLVKLLYPYAHPNISEPLEGDNFSKFMCFVEDYPAAARAFYRNSRKEISFKAAWRFVVFLIQFVTKYAFCQSKAGRAAERKRSRRRSSSEEEKESQDKEDLQEKESDSGDLEAEAANQAVSNFPVASEGKLTSIFDVMCILLTVHIDILYKPSYIEFLNILRKELQRKLHLVQRFYKDRECVRSFLYLSSLLLSHSSTTLPSMLTNKLKSLPEQAPEEDYCYVIDLLCNWQRADNVLDIVSEWVTGALHTPGSPRDSSTRKSRVGNRRVQFSLNDDEPAKPLLGFAFLSYLLKSPGNKRLLLKKFVKPSLELRNKLSTILNLIGKRMNNTDLALSDELLLVAFTAYLRLTAVLNWELFDSDLRSKAVVDEEDQAVMRNCSEHWIDIFAWMERSLLPHLEGTMQSTEKQKKARRRKTTGSDDNKQMNALSFVGEVLSIVDSLIIVHGVNKQCGLELGKLTLKCLEKCTESVLLSKAMRIACNLQLFFLNQDPPEPTREVSFFDKCILDEPVVMQLITRVLVAWIEKHRHTSEVSVHLTDVNAFKLMLKSALGTYCREDILTPVGELTKQVLLAMIKNMSDSLKDDMKRDVFEQTTGLPSLVSALLSVVSNKTVGGLFLSQLESTIPTLTPTELLAIMHVLYPAAKEMKSINLECFKNCVKKTETVANGITQGLSTRTSDENTSDSISSEGNMILELVLGIINDLKKKCNFNFE